MPGPLGAQAAASAQLDFFGFRPGAPREEVEAGVAAWGGRWQCETARADRRFVECRGVLRPPGHRPLSVTGSLIDGRAAILLLAAPVSAEELEAWVDMLSTRYGQVAPVRRQGQTVWQWVRRGRMIRVTTRLEGGQQVVSVSLVDGTLLDALNGPASR